MGLEMAFDSSQVSLGDVYVLPPGQDSVIEVEIMELLPVGRDDFALLLFVCSYVFHGGMRQQA